MQQRITMATTPRSLTLAGLAGFGLSLLSALPAGAHGFAGTGLAAGALHPLSGLDHLLLLVGLAALVARVERRLLLPALVGAVLGAGCGLYGAILPAQETLAALAVAALGGLLLLMRRLRPAGGLRLLAGGVVGAATAVHALLHGQEASADPAWWLGSGLAATAVVTVVALLLRRCGQRTITVLALLLGGSGLALAVVPLL